MKKTLFFLPDSFHTNHIVESYCAIDSSHELRFIVLTWGKARFITHPKIKLLQYQSIEFYEYIGDLSEVKNIQIHYLEENVAHFIWSNRKFSFKVTWVLWGADLYRLIDDYPLYLEQTKELVCVPNTVNKKFSARIKDVINGILGRRSKTLNIKLIRKRIDVIACSFNNEFKIVQQNFPGNYVFQEYFHFPINEYLNIKELNKEIMGNEILVGNSGDPSNNHYEVFLKLKDLGLQNKINCPLAYGKDAYISEIVKQGKVLLGDVFDPWLNLVPKEEYNNKLVKINVAIFNNTRQQAFANIVSLLWLGAKVFFESIESIV